MIAVDTNILVHAHRRDSRWHAPAAATVRRLAEGTEPWAIPWPCIHEYYSITTHPRLYAPPSSPGQALAQLRAWRASPTLTLLAEDVDYWPVFDELVDSAHVRGGAIHDLRIAALCLRHGVSLLYTADRDFSRFARLATENPLVS